MDKSILEKLANEIRGFKQAEKEPEIECESESDKNWNNQRREFSRLVNFRKTSQSENSFSKSGNGTGNKMGIGIR